jgi:homopolymeric O-antigen transport system ATP-binding protein
MSRTVISVEKLSKEYVIGGRERAHGSFREMLLSAAAAPFRRFRRLSGEVIPEERIWALKDVSFEVREGEVVGIIGRNGAGKSTLLKILSRITSPTEGRVKIRGRVSSLLEVGTGFHHELTGRENIYLNGAILGMSRTEINRKFDEIVEFSGVEKFLDTPVKRYSSGMQVRLAFAVAAHLKPEVLIVDEVLAVGDAEFQRKCLGKIGQVGRDGRTVLFVSHNLQAVTGLCERVILLNRGQVQKFYDCAEVAVSDYLRTDNGSGTTWHTDGSLPLNEYFNPSEILVRSLNEPLAIDIRGNLIRNDRSLAISLAVYGGDNSLLFSTTQRDLDPEHWLTLPLGPVDLSVEIPSHVLNEGNYYAELSVFLHNRQYLIPPGTGPRVYFVIPPRSYSEFWDKRRAGHLALLLPWICGQGSCKSDDSARRMSSAYQQRSAVR